MTKTKIRRKQLLAARPQIEKDWHVFLRAICGKYAEVSAQHPIGPYFVDFLVKKGRRKIIIEIDGGYHTKLKQHVRDIQKTDYFVQQHYSVWRLTPEAAKQMTRQQIAKELWRLLHKQDVTWQNDGDVEHPLDPAVQFKQHS
jgi:very-short-patch-repair endonuclease